MSKKTTILKAIFTTFLIAFELVIATIISSQLVYGLSNNLSVLDLQDKNTYAKCSNDPTNQNMFQVLFCGMRSEWLSMIVSFLVQLSIALIVIGWLFFRYYPRIANSEYISILPFRKTLVSFLGVDPNPGDDLFKSRFVITKDLKKKKQNSNKNKKKQNKEKEKEKQKAMKEETEKEKEEKRQKRIKARKFFSFVGIALLFVHIADLFVMRFWQNKYSKNIYSLENFVKEGRFDYNRLFELVIFSPLKEEIIFRSLMFLVTFEQVKTVLNHKKAVWLSLLVGNLAFGLVHFFNLISTKMYNSHYVFLQVILGIIVGSVLACRMYVTNFILESILIHQLNNLFSCWVSTDIFKKERVFDTFFVIPILHTVIVYLLIFAISYFQVKKKVGSIDNVRENNTDEKKDK
ncbi:hypothetical protein M0813_15744 [Anaeramoeba flamelloides]|uniref:CAAX prenyl protease 2/Lysostaphin resistance protein A-like domain-containing protein n=1 Tax=Anaeramoeba flamelloides TaxID=1746091 RepID=A0ABQ8Z203_9EUKA|nr:hypothetical protein M0813_15744 [Anaeramoeba flamelloides]